MSVTASECPNCHAKFKPEGINAHCNACIKADSLEFIQRRLDWEATQEKFNEEDFHIQKAREGITRKYELITISINEMLDFHLYSETTSGVPEYIAFDGQGRAYVWPIPFKINRE